MRLKLTLNCRPNSELSLNYHYALQAVIYKVLEGADPVFSSWLHEHGYQSNDGKRQFRLFTFSDLKGLYKLDFERQTIRFPSGSLEWIISFCVDATVEKFVVGIFQNQKFTVATSGGRIAFEVRGIEILVPPVFTETMKFRTLMPICIAEQQPDRAQPKYLAPDEPNYEKLFLSNLDNKCQAAFGKKIDATNARLKILSAPRKRGMEKQKSELDRPIKLIGYNFDFELTAPIDWLCVGYDAGFGKSTSAGFGFCGVVR